MADRSEAEAGPIEPAEVDPAGASASPPPMDSALGGAGRTGSLGGAGWRDDTYALGWGWASAAAWTRLVSSGVADDLVSAGGGGGAGGPPPPPGHFLDACFLCRKPLANNRDIFMYRGDIPFCTEECRKELIEMDEEMERKEATTKKVAQITPSTKDVDSSPKPPKTRAGSILAG